MTITVYFTAHLKAAAGSARQTLLVEPGGTLADCFSLVCDRASDALRTLIVDERGELRPSIILCVNDEQTSLTDPTPLAEDSEVTFLAAISGG